MWLPGSSLGVGLRAACWTNFIHRVFGGLLLEEGQAPLFEQGKKEAKKGAPKGDLGFSSCGCRAPSLGNQLRTLRLGLSAPHNDRGGEKTDALSFHVPPPRKYNALKTATCEEYRMCTVHTQVPLLHHCMEFQLIDWF